MPRGAAGLTAPSLKKRRAVAEQEQRREESSIGEDDDDEREEEEEEEEAPAKPAAWRDEDDAAVAVDLRSQSRLKKLRATTKERVVGGDELSKRLRERFSSSNAHGSFDSWARKRGDEGGLGSLAGTNVVEEREARLEVARRVDANGRDPSRAVVQAVDFEPEKSNLMLVAGLDRHVRLFQVDGERNDHRLSLFAEDLPFYGAKFLSRRKIVAAGRRPFFYVFDVESGAAARVEGGSASKSLERFAVAPSSGLVAFAAEGKIRCCDARRGGLWAHSDLRLNGSVRALAFASDSTLVAGGGDGEIYKFDLRQNRCLAKFEDLGRSVTSALVATPNFVAVGSESGVVNLYDDHDAKGLTFRRAILNLTTPVDRLALNATADLLVLSSKWSKDALRVANLRTDAVYAHWPTHKTPLHFVSAAAFSHHDHFLAIGNDRGRVLLYQLRRPD